MAESVCSMTGFGRATASLDDAEASVEIRTLNGRYLDAKIRVPHELARLEPEIRRRVQTRLQRGRVDVFLQVEFRSGQQFQLNEALIEGIAAAARRLRKMGFAGKVSRSALLQMPGVLEPRRFDAESKDLEKALLQAVDEALEETVRSRRAEGSQLGQGLERRLEQLRGLLARIEETGGSFADHYREKLRRKIEDLSPTVPVDEARLAQEIIFFAERADISEEKARLKTHIDRFAELLGQPPSEGAGKNLDFLCQEMNREANTIVSKSPLAEISDLAVQAKLEIEKIREQVQNVE